MNAACIPTPWQFCVHFYDNLSFEICPEDEQWASRTYCPAAVAHWLVAEGFDLLFDPDYRPLEIELPAQGEDW